MPPRTRARARAEPSSTDTSKLPRLEATDAVDALSSQKNLDDNDESKSISHAADDTAPQSYASVLGATRPVPELWDPDTYDPNGRMSWTPEPDHSDPEAWETWGRKHFGQEWYKLRKTMLAQRNTYLEHDPVYRERQRALRVMEHHAEGRPFRPRDYVLDQGWKRLWARLSKDFPPDDISPMPSDDDTDLSGFDTYPPTPESREPTPIPDDPWERLEFYRKKDSWDQEWYEFQKIFLKEESIDRARAQLEDEPGNKKYREKRDLMESFRYVNPARFDLEKCHLQNHIDLPKEGWTLEEIIALYEADVALHIWLENNPMPRGSGEWGTAVTRGQKAAENNWLQRLDAEKVRAFGGRRPEGSAIGGFPANQDEENAWNLWRKNTHARVSAQQHKATMSGTMADAPAELASKPRGPLNQQKKNVLRQTRSGRVNKGKPTQAKGSPSKPSHSASHRNAPKSGSNIIRTARQRGTGQSNTKKGNTSRKPAAKSPRGEMRGGARASKQSKKPSNALGAKHQGIAKSRTGRAKRLTK